MGGTILWIQRQYKRPRHKMIPTALWSVPQRLTNKREKEAGICSYAGNQCRISAKQAARAIASTIAIGVPKGIASHRFCSCPKKPNKISDDLDASKPYSTIDENSCCLPFTKYNQMQGHVTGFDDNGAEHPAINCSGFATAPGNNSGRPGSQPRDQAGAPSEGIAISRESAARYHADSRPAVTPCTLS
jgi:hypothetical protein